MALHISTPKWMVYTTDDSYTIRLHSNHVPMIPISIGTRRDLRDDSYLLGGAEQHAVGDDGLLAIGGGTWHR